LLRRGLFREKKKKKKKKFSRSVKKNYIIMMKIILICCLLVGCALAQSQYDLAGDYSSGCSSLAGLGPSWRIEERQVLHNDQWTAITAVYSDVNCATPVIRYDRNM
jgi:hypothetical protein